VDIVMQIFKKKTNHLTTSKNKRSFINDERGVTAIEFGLLAVPFISIIAIILQTAIVFIAGMLLDNAVNDSIRLIRTGQAEAQNFTIANFREKLCDQIVGLLSCNDIKIRVRHLPDFNASQAALSVIDPATGAWTLVEQYNDGIGKSIIIAEAYYKWDPVIDFKWLNIGAGPDGKILLGSARVWRNEPF